MLKILRANLPLNRVFKSLGGSYDKAIQNGAQVMANLNQRAFDAQKANIKLMGSYGHRQVANLHNSHLNMDNTLSRLQNLESRLDSRLSRAQANFERNHEMIRRTQNYLTSRNFKQNAVVTGGVLGTTMMMTE